MRFAVLAVALSFAQYARADCWDPNRPDSVIGTIDLAGDIFDRQGGGPPTPTGVGLAPPGGVWLLDAFPGVPGTCQAQPPADVVTTTASFWLVRVPPDANPGDVVSFCEAYHHQWPWSASTDPGCGCFDLTVASPPATVSGVDFAVSVEGALEGQFSGCTTIYGDFPIVDLTLGDDVDPAAVALQVFTSTNEQALPAAPTFADIALFAQKTRFLIQDSGRFNMGFRLIRISDGAITPTQLLSVDQATAHKGEPCDFCKRFLAPPAASAGEGEGEGEGEGAPKPKSTHAAPSCASTSTSGIAISAVAGLALAILGARRRRT